MNVLAHHIKVLLLTHDHVALPQFGTFFTDTAPACRVEDDVFAPVRCSLHFTPEIDDADILLEQSIMRAYHLTPEQAAQRVRQLVAEAGRTLASTGMLDFDILGTFHLQGGRITFAPCTAGLIVPEYYGLDAVGMALLPMLASQAVASRQSTQRQSSPRDSYVIRLNRSAVHYAASIAAAILLFFIFNTPLGYNIGADPAQPDLTGMFVPHVNRPDLADMQPQPIAEPLTADTLFAAEEDALQEVVAEPSAEQSIVVEQTAETVVPAAVLTPATPVKPYTVVLASNVSERGANDFVARLKADGYSAARVVKGTMIRVVYGSYATDDEARRVANELKGMDAQFAGAWILKQ